MFLRPLFLLFRFSYFLLFYYVCIVKMNTSVLRIGNYVLHAGKVIAVTSVFPKGINACTDPSTGKVSYVRATEVEPIPLLTDMLRQPLRR